MKRVTLAVLQLYALLLVMAPQAFAAGGDPVIDADVVPDAAGHGADHAEASAGLPQFDPSSFPSQIFWLAVAFAFLYLFFSRRTLPEISNVIENRRQHIQSDLDTAEDLRRQAEEAHRAYEEALEKARTSSTEYYLETETTIKEKTSERMNAFYANAAEQIAETEKRINHAKSEAMEEMSGVAAEIAANVAEKILGVSTDLNQAKTVVQSLHNQKAA